MAGMAAVLAVGPEKVTLTLEVNRSHPSAPPPDPSKFNFACRDVLEPRCGTGSQVNGSESVQRVPNTNRGLSGLMQYSSTRVGSLKPTPLRVRKLATFSGSIWRLLEKKEVSNSSFKLRSISKSAPCGSIKS